MRYALGFVAVSAVLWVGASASAQAAEGEQLPPPPPADPTPAATEPPADPTPAPAETPTATPAPVPATSCAPPCREGYMCHDGRCISACNPPCAAGERCTQTGACVVDATPPPAMNWQPAPDIEAPDKGVEEHDGFMLRLALGFGSGTLTQEVTGAASVQQEFSGFGATFSVDLGGSVTENLILHGRISDFLLIEPSYSIDGMDMGDITDASVGSVMFGAGLTYYFMPINLYVTGVVGPARVVQEDDGTTRGRSEYGVGLNLDLGKEWWVGDQWGLGAALRLWFNTATEDLGSLEVTRDLVGGALMFSATYQ